MNKSKVTLRSSDLRMPEARVEAILGRRTSNASGSHDSRPNRERTRKDSRRNAINRSQYDG